MLSLLEAWRSAPAALLLAGALPAAVAAQDAPETTPWMAMSLVGVDPGQVDEFLAAQRELAALEQKAGVPWRSVSRTAVFGDTYRFVIVTPLAQFAGLDRPARPDPARVSVERRIRSTVTSRQTFALRTTPDIDNPLPDGRDPALMLVQLISVVPGRERDYIQVMAEEVLPHFKEANMHHSSGALTLGGDSGYVHFFHLGNFAALDQGSPMARALGPAGALEVTAKLAGVLARTEQWVVRHLPDLSFRQEAEAEGEN
ncbi:MAG: hypothetical protein OYL41_13140 [Acidobacteriota bacterium]|nr:hypothetical protein [Acidobacteriota bacterium]